MTSKAGSQHEAIFSMLADHVVSVRSEKWKLHVVPPKEQKRVNPAEKWIDARGPDGVTILAPYEQAHPSEYPGLFGPEPAKALSLFDLQQDPSEQHDVSDQHPDVVQKMKTYYDSVAKTRP